MIMFCYFDGFPDDVDMVGPDVGCDLCSVVVSAFISMGCLACSQGLGDMWWPVWPMYILFQHEQGIL